MQKSFLFPGCGARLCAGQVFFFGQVALRSARARGRESFFFKLVLALVARGMFYLTVKWLALRAGAPVARGWFFLSVKWLALRAGQR